MPASSHVVAIVQARFGSSRLPGKVLLDLAGRPALWHVRERLRQVPELDRLVVATTAAEGDRPVVEAVTGWGGEAFAYAGDVNDLLDRYITCGEHFDADIIVMVDGDCPLLHPPTVSRMIRALQDQPAAEYARLESRTIEGGVAVLRLAAYRKIRRLLPEMPPDRQGPYREHATLCIMERPELFTIVEVPCFPELARFKHRLWLDTPADLEFLRRVYETHYREGEIISLPDVVEFLAQNPDVRAINAHVGQKTIASPNGFVRLGGDSAITSLLARTLAEEYGLACRQEPGGDALAEVAVTPGEPGLRHASGPDGLRLTLTAPDAAGAARLAPLLAAALGVERLRSGYFEAAGSGPELETVPCPLCRGADIGKLWVAPSGAEEGICANCGHVFLSRRPTPARLAASYRAYAQTHPEAMLVAENSPFVAVARARVRRLIDPARPPAAVLDVGCGYGHFLRELPVGGRRVGLEPSAVQAAFLRRHGWADEVWACGYEAVADGSPSWPAGGFDLITSFHALEHVADPAEFVRFCARHLAPAGRLALAVPELETLGADLIEAHYLNQGFHLHSFHAASLRSVLERAGLVVQSLEAEPPTAALKSSVLAVAVRPAPTEASAPVAAPSAAEVAPAARRTFARLEAALERIRSAFTGWRARGLRIAVYGGGVHTASLLDVVGPEGVAFIVDDDPAKQGERLAGVPIAPGAELAQGRWDVLVVSSLASEAALLARLETPPRAGKIFGIYRDLVNDAATAR